MRGWSAGANAANQASVLLASLEAPLQASEELSELSPAPPSFALASSPALEQVVAVFSSAVPVLPATVTPGIAAAVPVPSRTTAIISLRTVRATEALVTTGPGAGGAP